MDSKQLIKSTGAMLILKGHDPVCPNVKYLFNDWECDVVSLSKSGFIYEFEVKISRGDFLKERTKSKKQFNYMNAVEKLSPNYFSYVCPEGMIKPEEIQPYSGLYYFKDDAVTEIVKPKMIHSFKRDRMELLEKFCRVYSQRQFLGKCLMTHKNDLIKKRNAGIL